MNNTEIIINALSKGSGGGGGVGPLVITENDYDLEEMLNHFNKGGAIYFEGDFEAESHGEEPTAHGKLLINSVIGLEGLDVFTFSCMFLIQGIIATAIATVSELGVEKTLLLQDLT